MCNNNELLLSVEQVHRIYLFVKKLKSDSISLLSKDILNPFLLESKNSIFLRALIPGYHIHEIRKCKRMLLFGTKLQLIKVFLLIFLDHAKTRDSQ